MAGRIFKPTVFQNVSDKAPKIHAWLDWTCTELPFIFCEKDSTKKLQITNFSLADTRLIFDSILNNFGKKYETLKNHLSGNTAVVQSPEFERAIVVSCRGEKLTFSQEETIKKIHFLF